MPGSLGHVRLDVDVTKADPSWILPSRTVHYRGRLPEVQGRLTGLRITLARSCLSAGSSDWIVRYFISKATKEATYHSGERRGIGATPGEVFCHACVVMHCATQK